jgi:hypothetical protein
MFIGKPVLDHRATAVSDLDRSRSALMAEREQLLDALQELDFDFSLGKIQQEDYSLQRREMLEKGKDILQDLESVEVQVAASRPRVSDAIEKAIADRAQPSTAARQPIAADDGERVIAARKRERSERSAGFCPQCGNAVQQSDKFCSKCGTVLA